jgi:hypothetical protein
MFAGALRADPSIMVIVRFMHFLPLVPLMPVFVGAWLVGVYLAG